MNSRTKGKRGELEAAAFLTVNGIPARRGCQFSGSPDSPDIVSDYLRGVHFEVKRTQRTDLEAWLAQAEHDVRTRVGLITTSDRLARATELPFGKPSAPVLHGGLRVRLYATRPLPVRSP